MVLNFFKFNQKLELYPAPDSNRHDFSVVFETTASTIPPAGQVLGGQM